MILFESNGYDTIVSSIRINMQLLIFYEEEKNEEVSDLWMHRLNWNRARKIDFSGVS